MKGWQDVFGTADKAEVATELRETGQDFSWEGDNLRICSQQAAVETHPLSGEKIWFNHTLVSSPLLSFACLTMCFLSISFFRCFISQCCRQNYTMSINEWEAGFCPGFTGFSSFGSFPSEARAGLGFTPRLVTDPTFQRVTSSMLETWCGRIWFLTTGSRETS